MRIRAIALYLPQFHPISENDVFAEGNNLLFINAWNKWAKGNHLEPDQPSDRGYLQQVKLAVDRWPRDENES